MDNLAVFLLVLSGWYSGVLAEGKILIFVRVYLRYDCDFFLKPLALIDIGKRCQQANCQLLQAIGLYCCSMMLGYSPTFRDSRLQNTLPHHSG